MPTWDEESPSTDASPDPVQLERLRDDVRTAAQQDAADIVARARRDIRRVVTDARRELLELSAQLQAVNVTLPDAALPDPSVIADEELPASGALPGPGAPRWLTDTADRQTDAAPRPAAEPVAHPHQAFDGGVATPDEASPVAESGFELVSEAPPSRRWIPIAAIAAVLIVVAVAWLSRRGARDSVAQPSAGVSSAPSATAPTPPASAGGTEAGPPSSDAGAATSTAGLTLDLSWQRSTWVRTTIDGTADAGRIYEAGTTRHIEAADAVILRAGDAGALMVAVDGGTVAPLGDDGTTLTRQFARPAAGSGSAAPTPSPRPAPSPAVPAASAASTGSAASASPAVNRAPATAGTASTPAAPPSTASATGTAPSDAAAPARPVTGRVDLTVSGQQWLDAYHRQDRPAMESVGGPGAIVSDDRRPEQRFPFGLDVTRRFEDVGLSLSGDTAVYTGRMIERAATGEHASRVTQTWVRRMGTWRLQDSRIAADVSIPRP